MNSEIDLLLKKKNHPQTNEINRVREIILSVDDRIEEVVKWSSPTFVYKGNICSVNLRGTKILSLMFHQGAKISGKHKILEGDAKFVRTARFNNMEDIENKKEALDAVIRQWIADRDQN